jgi:hypothetical protein
VPEDYSGGLSYPADLPCRIDRDLVIKNAGEQCGAGHRLKGAISERQASSVRDYETTRATGPPPRLKSLAENIGAD